MRLVPRRGGRGCGRSGVHLDHEFLWFVFLKQVYSNLRKIHVDAILPTNRPISNFYPRSLQVAKRVCERKQTEDGKQTQNNTLDPFPILGR